MKLRLEVDIEIVEKLDPNTVVARIYYPDEGDKIQICKGLNTIELSHAIFHEIGHLVDWYLNGKCSLGSEKIRERNADIIGNGLRFKENYPKFSNPLKRLPF